MHITPKSNNSLLYFMICILIYSFLFVILPKQFDKHTYCVNHKDTRDIIYFESCRIIYTIPYVSVKKNVRYEIST